MLLVVYAADGVFVWCVLVLVFDVLVVFFLPLMFPRCLVFLSFFWLMLWLALSGLSLSLLSLLVSCLRVTVGAVVIVVGIVLLGHVDLRERWDRWQPR